MLGEQAELWPIIEIGTFTLPPCPGAIRPWADAWALASTAKLGFKGPSSHPPALQPVALLSARHFRCCAGTTHMQDAALAALSLWDPGGVDGCFEEGPTAGLEVASAWLVGLGHLGQAYAWTLVLHAPGNGASLVLQDVDTVTSSTPSVSVLSTPITVEETSKRRVSSPLGSETRGYKTYAGRTSF